MQEQEGVHRTPEYAPTNEWVNNTDTREQQQWQTPPQQEYVERPYEEGYSGQDSMDAWFLEGEKIRPQQTRRRGVEGLILLVALVCVLLIAGNFAGLIFSWLSWSLLSIIAIIAAVVVISNWRVVTQPVPTQTFSVMEHPRLVLNNSSGKVTIRRGEGNVVTVAPTKRASGIGMNLESMHVQYNQQGDTINVATSVAWNIFQFGLRSIDFDILLPESCNVQVVNGSGRVVIQDVSGDIQLKTGSGRIEGGNLQGRVALKTGSGSITMAAISGEATLVTGSGRIEIDQAQLTRRSEFKTGSGSITFTGALDPRGNYRFQTGSGAVRLTLPPDSSLNLNGRTGSGRVVNEFATPVPGMPRAQLTIKTGSGGIYVQKRY